jgi:trk system potassium uptake protein TrkH
LARPRVIRHPARAVVAGFVATILVGAGLLSLPFCTEGPGGAPVLTALFTSTSAVCVTGLTVVDTATYWSPAGQAVILGLIQVGGIGIMTGAALLFLVLARRIGLRGRMAAQAETRSLGLGDVRRLVLAVVVLSLAFEVVAGVALTARLWLGLDRPLGDALWQGGFHAVSAFNNAGFSLYSDSLIGLATDGWFLVTVALAVIAGGLGFPVWLEIRRRPARPRRWTVHTKLTLAVTLALLVLGTLAITALEWDNPETLGQHDAPGRLLGGFFAAVMPRTAGFNAIDYGQAGPDTLFVTDGLMLIGGGSGSTAGGLKVTTLALLLLIVWAEVRGDREVVAFRRRLPEAAQRQALTIAVLATIAVAAASLALMATNDLGLSPALFESVSAFATVGLSTGVTPALDDFGQALLVPLMLLGRVGPLTLAVALALRERELLFSHPEERPLVG